MCDACRHGTAGLRKRHDLRGIVVYNMIDYLLTSELSVGSRHNMSTLQLLRRHLYMKQQ